jgi:hypothetical protein
VGHSSKLFLPSADSAALCWPTCHLCDAATGTHRKQASVYLTDESLRSAKGRCIQRHGPRTGSTPFRGSPAPA